MFAVELLCVVGWLVLHVVVGGGVVGSLLLGGVDVCCRCMLLLFAVIAAGC